MQIEIILTSLVVLFGLVVAIFNHAFAKAQLHLVRNGDDVLSRRIKERGEESLAFNLRIIGVILFIGGLVKLVLL